MFQHSAWFMIICMFFAGYMSTMNVWIDKWDDFRFSLNDFYMVGLMTGWMLFFMGLFSLQIHLGVAGALVAGLFFILIRGQYFVNEIQYLNGMIPHHSMAVMMSKRLAEKPNTVYPLLQQIIQSQEKEILIMKKYLNE
jgi:hypothetical protein